jgi:hypothetical protein
LSQPFEEVVAAVFSLPKAPGENPDGITHAAEEVERVVRGLYEAANGRHVETTLGFIPIAPPVAPFLNEEPFEVATQLDFFVEVASRVLAGRSRVGGPRTTVEPAGVQLPETTVVPLETAVREEDTTHSCHRVCQLDHERSLTLATSL